MRERILLIDDDEIVVKSIEKLLKKVNYSVDVAQSGKEAMEQIKESNFNMVISDVRMPGINGIETIKMIREYLKKNGKSPVPEILITGYACKENYHEAQELNVAAYIYKPFDIKGILTAIRTVLSLSAKKNEQQCWAPVRNRVSRLGSGDREFRGYIPDFINTCPRNQ